MGAATRMVFTAGSPFKWAATPSKAGLAEFVDTAAGGAFGTSVVVVANSRGLNWGRRRWAWVGGI